MIREASPRRILKLLDNPDNKINYICGFSMNSCKDLYEIPKNEYIKVFVKGSEINCYRLTKQIWGKSENVTDISFRTQ